MRTIAESITKLIVSYLTVFLTLILLPVFLITSNDIAIFDQLMNFLFGNNK